MAKKARGTSRTQRRQALMDAASNVQLPPHTDVCVVGGGASGLIAAICAARQGAATTVLESAFECGQKILATGNGRCNFANAHLDSALYNDPAFVRAVTGETWFEDILRFFANDCGLAWEQEDDGRCYPLSRQAASVRNVLLSYAGETGVVLAPGRNVTSVKRHGMGFSVTYREMWDNERLSTIEASCVVVATGGGVSAVCSTLGLATTPIKPILCPLACEGTALGALDGRRVRAQAMLVRKDVTIACERGEVLFRPYGLSGIVIFNMSRYALSGDEFVLDLLPTIDAKNAQKMAMRTLDGLLDPVIAQVLIEESGSFEQATALAKEMRYRVVGPTETDRAQVLRGGMANDQFNPSTLEAQNIRGLFACGEALDVDGPCGGYNLAWAWKSGMVAGNAAGRLGRIA